MGDYMDTTKENFIRIASRNPQFRHEGVTKSEIRAMLLPGNDVDWTPRWRRVAQTLRKTLRAWQNGTLGGVKALMRVFCLCIEFVQKIISEWMQFRRALEDIFEETIREVLEITEDWLTSMTQDLVFGW
jgi:hypothetical protein